jgi:hypothetical protein
MELIFNASVYLATCRYTQLKLEDEEDPGGEAI